ncbi:MAG: trans-4-hydroxy-L-proline dehydratase activase [Solirubrobacterales bacterium]
MGLVFNIQKFSIHDGPGIRTTVFFKGCPLKCLWCHNPESQSFNKEIMISTDKCTDCGRCVKHCSSGAISINKGEVINDLSKCTSCGKCIDYCINNARGLVGEELKNSEIIKEIQKDQVFYDQSKGGVTFSGGEAMCQIDTLAALAKRCKEQGVSVAVDTCGHVPFDNYEKIIDYVDVFLYDIKLMDSELHEKYMGTGNELILENLIKLSERGANINLRIPVIGGINDNDENMESILKFINCTNINKVNLLPYHDIAKNKYDRLLKIYEGEFMKKPSDERMNELKKMFEKNGYITKIGG